MEKVGLYVGSFNPFHKGHFNILLKAEQIFGKVIIGRGENKKKSNNPIFPMPNFDKFGEGRFEVVEYKGLVTKFIETLPYDVTVIRGLRNSTDLQVEMEFNSWLKYLKPDIKVVSLFCDSEYEFVSSSGIRILLDEGDEDGKAKNLMI